VKSAPGKTVAATQVDAPAMAPARRQTAAARYAEVYGRVLLPMVATAIVAGGQIAEDLADSPPMQMLPPAPLLARWTVIALVAYVFGILALVERTVERSLAAVRPVVKISDEAFAAYRAEMRLPQRIDALLLIASAAIVATLFGVLGSDLLVDDPVTGQSQHLPAQPLAAILVMTAYAIIGWAFLRVVASSAIRARALARLTRETLEVKVFDTTDLIPFGNLALALALAPAGVIVILIIGLGSPTTPFAWSVLVAATLAVLLALFLPLRGIHHQMSVAKYSALWDINARIAELYRAVTGEPSADPSETARLSNSTNSLVLMRKAVQEMTTWPFRDTVAFGRAVLIAAAPLIYTTLSELIKVFWIGPLSGP
jgi:hypothetical protein